MSGDDWLSSTSIAGPARLEISPVLNGHRSDWRIDFLPRKGSMPRRVNVFCSQAVGDQGDPGGPLAVVADEHGKFPASFESAFAIVARLLLRPETLYCLVPPKESRIQHLRAAATVQRYEHRRPRINPQEPEPEECPKRSA